MSFEEALYAYLAARAEIQAAVGNRIYQWTYPIPAGGAAYPDCLVYRLESSAFDATVGGDVLVNAQYSVACVSADPITPVGLAALVGAALRGFKGVMGGAGGLLVSAIRQTNAFDEFDGEAGLFVRVCEFSVAYKL